MVDSKFRFLTIVLCFIFSDSFANEKIDLGQICSYFGEQTPRSVFTFASDQEAEMVVSEIVAATGLPKNFLIKSAGVPNAAAVVIGSKRYILYNEAFMYEIKKSSGSVWAAYSIMAHEIGHHLSGHTLDDLGSRPNLELEADRFSGFILQKLGASLKDARLVVDKVASSKASLTHPAKHDRLAAISNGWLNSCGGDSDCSKSDGKVSRVVTAGNRNSSGSFGVEELKERFSSLIAESKRIDRAIITDETSSQLRLIIDDVGTAKTSEDRKRFYSHANEALGIIRNYLDQKKMQADIKVQFISSGIPIQKKLNNLNCGAGPIDGDIGPQTSQALLRWDSVNKADEATLREIERLGDEAYRLAEASAKASDPTEYHKLYMDTYFTFIRKNSVVLKALNNYSRYNCK